MSAWMTRLYQQALDLVFPRECIGCGRKGTLLCPACRISLVRNPPPHCQKCAAPIRRGNLCSRCREAQHHLDGVYSPYLFEGTVRECIHWLKYRHLRGLALPLAGLLAESLQGSGIPGDILVPVPLHSGRERYRGYNQSALLARELSRLMGLPVDSNVLLRTKASGAQARTSGIEERRRNVEGAFACPAGVATGTRIILLDDVCTTGATLESCARALKARGATSVWAVTLAKER